MQNNFENLLWLEGRTPDKLKDLLMAIDVPCSVMQGSWSSMNGHYGCWVLLDRPVKSMKKREITKVEFSKGTNI